MIRLETVSASARSGNERGGHVRELNDKGGARQQGLNQLQAILMRKTCALVAVIAAVLPVPTRASGDAAWDAPFAKANDTCFGQSRG
jgi:hypothetical protein